MGGAISRSLHNSHLPAQMFRHLLPNPELAALVDSNWCPWAIDLDTPLALSEGSLGHVYAYQLWSQVQTPGRLIAPVRSALRMITSPMGYGRPMTFSTC